MLMTLSINVLHAEGTVFDFCFAGFDLGKVENVIENTKKVFCRMLDFADVVLSACLKDSSPTEGGTYR